ncbi:dTDP-4-dehydrorhamnose reductase [Corynebacterium sp. H127]|uniref:dTDP-4-dehydrorhamnose reductase n=1 Tax=Corynebacterium sp. H127 TaxID=3133418 RepID=UPI0030AFF913
MRVAVVGGNGQLGQALVSTAPAGVEVTALSRPYFDVTEIDVDKLAGSDVIINTAAYTNVDAAESDEATAHAVNALAPGELARVADRLNARFIHVSTDYVFGAGCLQRPLHVNDPKNPDTVYGRTKLAGEQAVLAALPSATIVRTAWLFTGDLQPHKDFVSTMLALARAAQPANVVADQMGSPTCALDLAEGLWQIAEREVEGVLHGVGAGQASWFELAREVYALAGAKPTLVQPCTTAQFPRPARRPEWSVLSTESWRAAELTPLPEWRTALRNSVSITL